MKRKLNDKDVPEEVSETVVPAPTKVAPRQAPRGFSDLDLDPRLLQAVSKQQFSTPTPIQVQAIPLSLAGRDVLARAQTGSGKTAAYALPLLHRILKQKASNSSATSRLVGLILVPTRELAAQVTKAIISFTAFCGGQIRTENVTRKEDEKVLRARLSQAPDVLVSTPGKVNALIEAGVISLVGLIGCVIDEADLVLSYGHEEDLRSLADAIPKATQMVLMSATLRSEVETLKALFCTDAVVLDLKDEQSEKELLKQYVVKCGEDEKFLLIYAIFMLKLIKGKVIVFVADIDRAYRLKMFLEQFGIRSCVLNSELPANSRVHAVEEFNRNVYDIIIASDENEVIGSEAKTSKKQKSATEDGGKESMAEVEEQQSSSAANGTKDADDEGDEVDETPGLGDAPPKKKRRRNERDAEYGISRGIDFKNVTCVLNFDLPSTSKSYTHRIGRTARAGQAGMALSFCVPASLYRKHKPTTHPACANDEDVLSKIARSQEKRGQSLDPYDFDMKRLDGFRYRMADALRAVTRHAVREARAKEIRMELIKSEKLKRHFEENPEDLAALRHDNETKAVRVQQHLKHVPEYLLPGGAKSVVPDGKVGFGKGGQNRIREARKRKTGKAKGKGKGKGDPLKRLGRK